MSYELTQRAKALLTEFFTKMWDKMDWMEVTLFKDRRWLWLQLSENTKMIINWWNVILEEWKTINPSKHDIYDIDNVLSLIFKK